MTTPTGNIQGPRGVLPPPENKPQKSLLGRFGSWLVSWLPGGQSSVSKAAQTKPPLGKQGAPPVMHTPTGDLSKRVTTQGAQPAPPSKSPPPIPTSTQRPPPLPARPTSPAGRPPAPTQGARPGPRQGRALPRTPQQVVRARGESPEQRRRQISGQLSSEQPPPTPSTPPPRPFQRRPSADAPSASGPSRARTPPPSLREVAGAPPTVTPKLSSIPKKRTQKATSSLVEFYKALWKFADVYPALCAEPATGKIKTQLEEVAKNGRKLADQCESTLKEVFPEEHASAEREAQEDIVHLVRDFRDAFKEAKKTFKNKTEARQAAIIKAEEKLDRKKYPQGISFRLSMLADAKPSDDIYKKATRNAKMQLLTSRVSLYNDPEKLKALSAKIARDVDSPTYQEFLDSWLDLADHFQDPQMALLEKSLSTQETLGEKVQLGQLVVKMATIASDAPTAIVKALKKAGYAEGSFPCPTEDKSPKAQLYKRLPPVPEIEKKDILSRGEDVPSS